MIRNLLLTCVTLALFLAAIELGLRLFGIAYPVFMQPNERLG